MIGFWLALVLWMVGAGPTPTPHGVTVSPAAPAPASVVVRGGEPRTPGDHPGASVPPAPTVATPPPAPDGELWDSPAMCNDPVDCPTGEPPSSAPETP